VASGTVKWFNEASGFGLIAPEGGGQDLFVHRASVGGDVRQTMAMGGRVEFEQREGGMGPEAINIAPSALQESPLSRSGPRQSAP